MFKYHRNRCVHYLLIIVHFLEKFHRGTIIIISNYLEIRAAFPNSVNYSQ